MNQAIKKVLQHPLLKKSFIYTVADAINKAIPFLILPFLTYYLTPADYGIVSNYTIFISVLVVFVGLNLNGALSANFFRMDKKEVATYTFNLMGITLVSATVLSLIMLVALGPVNRMISVTSFFTLAAVWMAFCQSISAINLDLWRLEEKAVEFGIYQISQTALNILLTVLLVIVYRWGWEGRLWALVITSVLFMVISLFILYKRGFLKPSVNLGYCRDALRFGLPLIPHTLGLWVRNGVDRIFITKFYGVAETGLYATGFQFGLLLSFLILAFHNAYIPHLYKTLTNGGEAVKHKLVRFTYLYMVVILVVAALFSLVSVFVIRHFLSSHYREASVYVWWAMFTQAFQGMYLMVAIYIFYAKRTTPLAITTFVVSLLQTLLSYFLIKYCGTIGAAYSALIMGIVNFVSLWMVSIRIYPMPWFNFRKQA